VKYNTTHPGEAAKAKVYLDQLIQKKAVVEVVKISPRRSLNQNSYLHLLLNAFGVHFGYNLEEAKLVYKQLNKDIYFYSKEVRGKKWEFMRSSADLTKEEMTKSIDTLREWSAKADYPLPTATDKGWLMEIENAIEQAKHYL
jgi:hypothetical protein